MRTFFSAFENFFFRYFQIDGRATRSEFWCVMPIVWLSILAFFVLDVMSFWDKLLNREPPSLNPLSYSWVILFLITLIPRFTLTIRRLQDSGRSGKWVTLPYTALFLSLMTALGMASAHPQLQMVLAGLAVAISMIPSVEDPNTLWLFAYEFADAARYVNWHTALSALMDHLEPVNFQAGAQNLQNGFSSDPVDTAMAMVALGILLFGPLIAISTYLVFMLMPSSHGENGHGGQTRNDPIRQRNADGSNPFAGYAALIERTAEEERVMALRRKAEVKALYRERILKQNP
ncbi:MAG: DUF805 domain-containing protein [Rhodobacteraceae bacterium]|nr:DUF805 domain-containing protein [Paracoccaceae bacterium]